MEPNTQKLPLPISDENGDISLKDLAEALPQDQSSRSVSLSGSEGKSRSNKLNESIGKLKGNLTHVMHMLYFSSTGDVEGLSNLLQEGADPNAADYDGRSPLHLAASEGKLKAVQTLLEHGANVNPRDRWNHTPLFDAKVGLEEKKEGNFLEIVSLLREKGGIDESHSIEKNDWEIDPSEIDFSKSRLIGKGAFGEIRKVTWRGTPVAVKTILPSLSNDYQTIKDFQGEVAILPKLRHPNIVQFLAAVTLKQPLMLITEFLPGGDLHDVIKEYGALPPINAVHYALDISRGMNYLHNHKPEAIIHRDLKPRNLLRDEGDHLKVADFGLSKLIRINSLHDVYKMTGETGSYRYMAPEVFRHEAYDTSVDVFSFAMIFFEMFEGSPPFFKTITPEGMAWKISMENLRPTFKAKTYPHGVKDLIMKCWSGKPSNRPSFSQIIEELEMVERHLIEERMNQRR